MPISTNLNIAPYYDDYDPNRDYYRVLFRPGVSVQTRELNQVQSILQNQLERFGDAIFRRGTIVDGVGFVFHESVPYVKINDLQLDGQPAVPSAYVGYFLKSSSNLVAYAMLHEDGFESTDPDLKTLYVRYTNSGNSGNETAFTPGETLTVVDSNVSIHSVGIDNGGSLFSNSDSVHFVSALVVNVTSSNAISNAYVIQESGRGSNATVIEANTTAIPGKTLLRIRPLNIDLANTSKTANAWLFQVGDTITSNNGSTATVERVVGSSAAASIQTDASGRVTAVTVTNRGEGYEFVPHVTVKPLNANATVSDLSLVARNYRARVTVSGLPNAVGYGYAFGVGSGWIYQKGHIVRVAPQVVIVDKYSTRPDGLAVGFDTLEDIVDSFEDPTLLDNTTGEPNDNAPGANRLRLTPTLTVVTSEDAAANDEFFTLVEWSEGLPFRQNPTTQYSVLGDEMARRTAEGQGDFVLDRFNVTTTSPSNSALEGTRFSVLVDPGHAYISGYRVKTETNYSVDVDKAIDTRLVEDAVVSIDLGRYIRVRELGGLFQFNTGDVVGLYSSAKGFLSDVDLVSSANTDPVGTKIGEARIRSLVHESGVPGTPQAVYRLYLFDVRMNTGKNFKSVRSVHYAGASNEGVADLVLELDPTTEANVAVIKGNGGDRLLFHSGVESLKNANNINYTYRTIDQTAGITNAGIVQVSLASNPSEFHPYTGNLTPTQLDDIYLTPLGNSLTAFTNATGTVATQTTATDLVGTATAFVSELAAGDYVYLSNGSNSDVRRVVSVSNNTHLVLDANAGFACTTVAVYRHFPRNAPIPLGFRDGFAANVDANGNILTIDLGIEFDAAANTTAAIGYNVRVRNANSAGQKTANRHLFARLDLSNNAGGVSGPWCLGVPDVFRLRGVYSGPNNTFVANDPGVADVTRSFFVDHNQNPNFLDLGWLYKQPHASVSLSNTSHLLVEFDAFTSTGTLFCTTSYVSSNAEQVASVDALPLEDLTTQVNTLEVPEVFGDRGEYYDLLDYFDFRPRASNTIPLTTNAAAAAINPSSTLSFGNTANPANDKKFPLPESSLVADVEGYLGRRDGVYVDRGNRVFVLRGIPSASDYVAPEKPRDTLHLNDLIVPPYPTIPRYPSNTVVGILNTRVANQRYAVRRLTDHVVSTPFTASEIAVTQPVAYTAEDIGAIDRRLRDVEYYVSLSALETALKDRVIPSSVSPSINRFKFGFFVDDFSTDRFSALDDPEYSAERENGILLPATERFNLRHGTGVQLSLPDYTEVVLIEQRNATESAPAPVPNTTPNTAPNTTPNTTPNTAPNTTPRVCIDRKEKSSIERGNTSQSYTDTLSITMASVNGNGVIYFHNFDKHDRIALYRGNTLVVSTNDAVSLTSNDQSYLANTPLFAGITFQAPQIDANGYARFSGKIDFTHTASAGREYRVVTDKGNGSTVWRYRICYPADNTVVQPPQPPTPNVVVNYDGTLVVAPDAWQVYKYTTKETSWETRTIASGSGGSKRDEVKQQRRVTREVTHYEIRDQSFRVTCTGLRPSTRHFFYYGDTDLSSRCKPEGGTLGDPLTTNASGRVVFDFYWTTGIDPDVRVSSAGTPGGLNLGSFLSGIFGSPQTPVGNRVFTVRTQDSTSKCSRTVTFSRGT